MTLAQENFERALGSAYPTLRMLTEAAGSLTKPTPQLRDVNTSKLEAIAWDLESIQAAIRLELINRPGPEHMDLG